MLFRLVLLAAVLAFTAPTFSTFAAAGNCDHSWQSAKDGSACGDRAADRRPGGK